MKKPTLLESNPYLKDKDRREAALIRTVESSTAIEGVHIKLRKSHGEAKIQPAAAHTKKLKKTGE